MDEQYLWALVQELNGCWYKGTPDRLAHFFHDDVVFNSPGFRQQIRGKELCIQTYIAFMNHSQVLLYREYDPKVQLCDSTAVITYGFEMKYEQKGKAYHETGTDILVFCRQQEHWKLIWRGLSDLKNI